MQCQGVGPRTIFELREPLHLLDCRQTNWVAGGAPDALSLSPPSQLPDYVLCGTIPGPACTVYPLARDPGH